MKKIDDLISTIIFLTTNITISVFRYGLSLNMYSMCVHIKLDANVSVSFQGNIFKRVTSSLESLLNTDNSDKVHS